VGVGCSGCSLLCYLPSVSSFSLVMCILGFWVGGDDCWASGACGSWSFLFLTFLVLSLSMRLGVWSGVPSNILMFPILRRLVGLVASLFHVENLFKVIGLPSFNV
jgi:hypothetical protein